MPSTLRNLQPGVVYHITQRGNNRMAVFHTDHDRSVYMNLLKEALERHQVELYAYCLMGNHVHLLAAARAPEGIPALMKDLQGRYARRFNLDWHRTGALWHQRYRATPVEDDGHMLSCFQYLDLNPVRARKVSRPEHWLWSSCRSLALGAPTEVLSPHGCYTGLGSTPDDRHRVYRRRMEEALADWLSLER
jgi:putative transposase